MPVQKELAMRYQRIKGVFVRIPPLPIRSLRLHVNWRSHPGQMDFLKSQAKGLQRPTLKR